MWPPSPIPHAPGSNAPAKQTPFTGGLLCICDCSDATQGLLPGPSCGLGQEWQTGKQVQHSAVMGLGMLWVATPSVAGASRLRGSGPPEEFSFPPDVDGFGGPWIGMSRWWRGPSARQGSVASTLMVSLCSLLFPPGGVCMQLIFGGHWLQ